jgi:hypothetical protein
VILRRDFHLLDPFSGSYAMLLAGLDVGASKVIRIEKESIHRRRQNGLGYKNNQISMGNSNSRPSLQSSLRRIETSGGASIPICTTLPFTLSTVTVIPPSMTMDSLVFLDKTSIFAALLERLGLKNGAQMPLASLSVRRVDPSSSPFVRTSRRLAENEDCYHLAGSRLRRPRGDDLKLNIQNPQATRTVKKVRRSATALWLAVYEGMTRGNFRRAVCRGILEFPA